MAVITPQLPHLDVDAGEALEALIESPAPPQEDPDAGVIEEARAHQRRRRWTSGGAVAALGALAAGLMLVLTGGGSGSPPRFVFSAAPRPFSPVVRHTGSGPTGYTVTFRYWDPSATRVQITGDWYFARFEHVGQRAVAADASTAPTSQGIVPARWQPGDFPLSVPNGTVASWPVLNMRKDPHTGIWSYTTPLPPGVFTYGFVFCSDAELADPLAADCTQLPDPSNPPWNDRGGAITGSVEPDSQVYVPSDQAFHTVSYWWEAPTSPQGTLNDFSYDALATGIPWMPGHNQLAIYTPPNYNPHRRVPYPTLYLSSGEGGNEVDWSTQGDAANIVDNLIDTHEVSPMIVVMTNFNFGDCGPGQLSAYDQNLKYSVIPYVQSHYDVSSAASRRAFAGVSCGGGAAASLLLDHPSEFGAFGVMSPLWQTLPTLSAEQDSALKHVGVMVGGGVQDPAHNLALYDLSVLRAAHVGAFADFTNGGHEWYVWRILLHDFLTQVAFKANAS